MTFYEWLLKTYRNKDGSFRNSPTGDLAYDASRDARFPKHARDEQKIRGYIKWERGGCREALDAFNTAWAGYRAYLRRRDRKEDRINMDETAMRLLAKLQGLEVMSFSADYKLPNGQDRHQAIQALGVPNDPRVAAQGIYEQLEAQGYVPQGIFYVHGDYTMAELDKLIDAPVLRHKITPMYVSEEAIREFQAAQHQ